MRLYLLLLDDDALFKLSIDLMTLKMMGILSLLRLLFFLFLLLFLLLLLLLLDLLWCWWRCRVDLLTHLDNSHDELSLNISCVLRLHAWKMENGKWKMENGKKEEKKG